MGRLAVGIGLGITAVQSRSGRLLDFTIGGARPGVAYARSGPASERTAAGLLTTFAADQIPATDLGLWAWPARTNALARSTDLAASPWSTFANGSGSIVRTAGAGLGPDGVASTALIEIDRSSADDWAIALQVFAGTAAAWQNGLWLKAYQPADVGKSVAVRIYNGLSTDTVLPFVLTADWTRRNVPATLAANAGCQFSFGHLPSGLGGAAQTGMLRFLATNAQAEEGASPTGDIPTLAVPAGRGLPSASYRVPAGCSTWTATDMAGTVTTGEAVAGAAFDLITPWLGLGLRRIAFA